MPVEKACNQFNKSAEEFDKAEKKAAEAPKKRQREEEAESSTVPKSP